MSAKPMTMDEFADACREDYTQFLVRSMNVSEKEARRIVSSRFHQNGAYHLSEVSTPILMTSQMNPKNQDYLIWKRGVQLRFEEDCLARMKEIYELLNQLVDKNGDEWVRASFMDNPDYVEEMPLTAVLLSTIPRDMPLKPALYADMVSIAALSEYQMTEVMVMFQHEPNQPWLDTAGMCVFNANEETGECTVSMKLIRIQLLTAVTYMGGAAISVPVK
jgi:hypothetical protein